MFYPNLILNTTCNWNCEYCDIPTIKQTQILNIEKYDSIFNYCKDWSNITLSGGEPGLLSKNNIEYFFNYFSDVSVTTNGVFIDQYLSKYKNKIKRIILHGCQDIDEPLNEYYIDFLIKNNIEFRIVLVIHKNNINIINEYIKKYNRYLKYFDYRVFTQRNDNSLLLSNVEILQLYKITGHHKFLRMINDDIDKKMLCIRNTPFFTLDFVNDRINRCCFSYTKFDSEKLTLDNILLLEKNKLFDMKWNETCKSCKRYER